MSNIQYIQHLQKIANHLKIAILNTPTYRTYSKIEKREYICLQKIKKDNIKLLNIIEKHIEQIKQ